MNQIEKTASQILKKYEIAEMKAAEAYRFAHKYGKITELKETRKAWNEALAIVIAVDEALADMLEALDEKASA